MPRTGRPSTYSKELANQICEQLAEGQLLTEICQKPEMPSITTVYRWERKYDEFCIEYARARLQQARSLVDKMPIYVDQAEEKIKDDPRNKRAFLEAARLRCDNIKWLTSRINRTEFGDKIDANVKQSGEVRIINIPKKTGKPSTTKDVHQTVGETSRNTGS